MRKAHCQTWYVRGTHIFWFYFSINMRNLLINDKESGGYWEYHASTKEKSNWVIILALKVTPKLGHGSV